MRAVLCDRFGSYQDLVLSEVPSPALAEGSVRIAVHFASVSYAISLMVAGTYQRKMTPPFVPGTEVSGVITECGPGVNDLKVGDRVAAIVDCGAFAEEVVIDRATVYPVPELVPLEQAVALPLSFGTATTALNRAGELANKTVLVTGAGGALGQAAVQVASLLGARVIAMASSPEKLDAAMKVGASEGIDYSTGDVVKKVKSLTEGRGADVVFDPVGGDVFASLIRATAVEGSILSLGFASGKIPAAPVNLLLVKNIGLQGVNFSEYVGWGKEDRRHQFSDEIQSMMRWLFQSAAEGKIRLATPELFRFEQVTEAIDQVVQRRAVGKVALRIR